MKTVFSAICIAAALCGYAQTTDTLTTSIGEFIIISTETITESTVA